MIPVHINTLLIGIKKIKNTKVKSKIILKLSLLSNQRFILYNRLRIIIIFKVIVISYNRISFTYITLSLPSHINIHIK